MPVAAQRAFYPPARQLLPFFLPPFSTSFFTYKPYTSSILPRTDSIITLAQDHFLRHGTEEEEN